MTDYVRTVQPSGGNYDSFPAATTAVIALMSSGDTATFVVSGELSGYNGLCVFGPEFSSTIPAGCSVTVISSTLWAGEEYDASALPSVRNVVVVNLPSTSSFQCIGLQNTNGADTDNVSGSYLLDGCLSQGDIPLRLRGSGPLRARNCALDGNGNGYGVLAEGASTDDAWIDNCYVTGGTDGVASATGATLKATNIISRGNSGADFALVNFGSGAGSWHADTSNNTSEDSTAPGANALTSNSPTLVSGTYLLDPADTSGNIGSGVATSNTTDVLGASWLTPRSRGINEAGEEEEDPIEGSLSGTLSSVALTSAAGASVSAGASLAVGAVAPSIAGTSALAGALAATLPEVSPSAAAGVSLAGAVSASLPNVSPSATGGPSVGSGLAATTGDVSPSAAAGAALSASLSATMPDVGFAAAGGALEIVSGILSVALAGVTPSAAGASSVAGSLAAQLESVALGTSPLTPPRWSVTFGSAVPSPVTATIGASHAPPVTATIGEA